MKRSFFISVWVLCLAVSGLSAQNEISELPSVDIRTLTGESFNTSEINNDGPIFVSFWATWCKPCIKELMAIDEHYIDWQDETALKVYAVSVDDSKSSSRVAPFINGRGWEFEVLLDANSDFKRAMNVVNVPHSFILDKDGKIVWQHASYSPGDEQKIYEVIKKLAQEDEVKSEKNEDNEDETETRDKVREK